MKNETVKQIQEYTKSHYGFIAKSCWIADVKEKCGLSVKSAWNRENPNERKNPCPADKIEKNKNDTAILQLDLIKKIFKQKKFSHL